MSDLIGSTVVMAVAKTAAHGPSAVVGPCGGLHPLATPVGVGVGVAIVVTTGVGL